MNVIAIEEEAFYTLINEVMNRLDKKKGAAPEKWISGEEAMQKLRIKSKTTLQKYRDQGNVLTAWYISFKISALLSSSNCLTIIWEVSIPKCSYLEYLS